MKKSIVLSSALVTALLLSAPVAPGSDDSTDGFLLRTAAPLRSVNAGDPPNVLLIVVDDLNVALGSYLDSTGRPQYASAKTPHIDRLASEGFRFERAYVQNPVCNPSRASLLSGLRPASTGVHDNRTYWRSTMGEDLRLLPEHFHDHGYFTARVGKIGHNTFEHAIRWDVSSFALSREPGQRFHLPGYLPGTDLSEVRDNTWRSGAEDGLSRAQLLEAVGRPGGLPLSWRATTESPRMTPDGTTATRIVQLLAESRDRPFFVAAGFHKPHQPWVGPASFFEQHPADEIELPSTPPDDTQDLPGPAFQMAPDDAAHTDRQKKQAIAAYHAMVTMTDSYVGQLLDALELLELEDSTLVLLTSDHGFQLSEHGGLWRKSVQFEESTRVPLIVRLPGARGGGQVVQGLVELVDLYPTLLDLAGLPAPEHSLEGTSFVPLFKDPERAWKSAVFSESRREGFHGRSYRDRRYRYTEWSPLPGAEGELQLELYDLQNDPLEYENLARDPAHEDLVVELAARFERGWRGALP
ncbi:MAG: sulfatase [Acidobacteriota bacterium]